MERHFIPREEQKDFKETLNKPAFFFFLPKSLFHHFVEAVKTGGKKVFFVVMLAFVL